MSPLIPIFYVHVLKDKNYFIPMFDPLLFVVLNTAKMTAGTSLSGMNFVLLKTEIGVP